MTEEFFKINNYDDRCITYLLIFKQCQKQYSGKTIHDFRLRWKNYKSSSKKFDWKKSCIPEHLYRRSHSPDYMGLYKDAQNRGKYLKSFASTKTFCRMNETLGNEKTTG